MKTDFLNLDLQEFQFRIKKDDIIFFAEQLSIMLKSGLSISRALAIVEEQSTGRFKKIISRVKRSVEAGNALSSSLRRYEHVFTSLLINIVKVGEASGRLEENLSIIASKLKKDDALISKIKSALVYPAIIFVASIILGTMLAFVILPKITPIFEGLKVDLPLSTRVLIAISNAVRDHAFIYLGGLLTGVSFFLFIIKQKISEPITHFVLIKMPVIKNIVKNINLARFFGNMQGLLASGVTIDKALIITQKSLSNYYYRLALADVVEHIGSGRKIYENLEEHKQYFPILVVSMIKIGEESGSLEEVLKNLSALYTSKVDNSTKNLSTLIEPLLLLFIGLIVGWLAISIIAPIYKITGNVYR